MHIPGYGEMMTAVVLCPLLRRADSPSLFLLLFCFFSFLCSSSLCFLFLMLPSPSAFVAFLSRRCHLSVFLLTVAFPLFPLFFFVVSFSLLFCFPLLLFSFFLSVSSFFFLFFPLCFLTFLCRSLFVPPAPRVFSSFFFGAAPPLAFIARGR